MRIDVKCYGAPWENTTTDLDRAYDLAYSLSEEYQCDVDLRYNETGIIFTTVSNYSSCKRSEFKSKPTTAVALFGMKFHG